MNNHHCSLFACIGLVLGLAGTVSASPVASPEVDMLQLRPNGTFTFDEVDVFAGHFSPHFSLRLDQESQQVTSGYPKLDGSSWQTCLDFYLPDVPEPITLTESVDKAGADSFSVTYDASHPTGVPSQEMFVQLEVPISVASGKSILLDGKPIELPVDQASGQLFMDYDLSPHVLVLPSASGTVTVKGTFRVIVQDQRQWGNDVYSVRLPFEPMGKVLTHEEIQVTLSHTPKS
jgi:hypothetical protein